MKGLGPFLLGVVVGGALTYGASSYHVLRSDDGFDFIPKAGCNFSDIYVDIRGFEPQDWAEHKELVLALMKAQRSDLLKDSTSAHLRRTIDGWLNDLQPQE